MSRYTDAKGRVNRALGLAVYENNGATKALERRSYKPGMHGQRKSKVSEFGLAMLEKKKVKHYYGLHEAQLAPFLSLAQKSPENTGETLLVLCERRLDNVVRRAGFARTRPQARQGVCHGHFRVNGRKMTIASYLVKPGDIITVAQRSNIQSHYRQVLTEKLQTAFDWISVDAEALSCTVHRHPSASDVSLPVEVNRVIELMTR